MDLKQNKRDDTFKIIGNWETRSIQLKKEFIQLTDADLKFETGKEIDLLTRMESKLKKTREEVINIIKNIQPARFAL